MKEKNLSAIDFLRYIHEDRNAQIFIVGIDTSDVPEEIKKKNPIYLKGTKYYKGFFSRTGANQISIKRHEIGDILGSLHSLNRKGLDIYFTAATYGDLKTKKLNKKTNQIEEGSRSRTRENVKDINVMFADFDYQGEAVENFKKGLGWNGIPAPSILTETSPGRFQTIWRMEKKDITLDQKADLQQRLQQFLPKSDPAVKDLSRILRLPGFKHNKRNFISKSVLFSEKKLSYDLFESVLPALPVPVPKVKTVKKTVATTKAKVPSSLEELDFGINENVHIQGIGPIATAGAIESFKDTYQKEKNKTAADWRVSCYLKASGVPEQKIAEFLLQLRGTKHEEYLKGTAKNVYEDDDVVAPSFDI